MWFCLRYKPHRRAFRQLFDKVWSNIISNWNSWRPGTEINMKTTQHFCYRRNNMRWWFHLTSGHRQFRFSTLAIGLLVFVSYCFSQSWSDGYQYSKKWAVSLDAKQLSASHRLYTYPGCHTLPLDDFAVSRRDCCRFQLPFITQFALFWWRLVLWLATLPIMVNGGVSKRRKWKNISIIA